jgi:hypothetical protein
VTSSSVRFFFPGLAGCALTFSYCAFSCLALGLWQAGQTRSLDILKLTRNLV